MQRRATAIDVHAAAARITTAIDVAAVQASGHGSLPGHLLNAGLAGGRGCSNLSRRLSNLPS